MKKTLVWLFVIFFVVLWTRNLGGQTPHDDSDNTLSPTGQALVLDVQGPIGPATRDFIDRSLAAAADQQAELLIIRMDTPGGLDASTRDIIKSILASTVPVATFVAPEGARAASAGTYILYASHIAAMSPASNVGAATPVAIIGGASPSDEEEAPDASATGNVSGEEETDQEEGHKQPKTTAESKNPMTRKAVNDSVAYIRGLAAKRGRNADWAERAVRDAESITSEEALKLGVIDFIAVDLDDVLVQADGMTVELNGKDHQVQSSGLTLQWLQPDWRNEVLSVITSPTIAYLLLLIGVYGLILEGYNPGAVLPGVVGAISLLLALYAFQMLPVNYAGLGLIVLGIILMIAETQAPSFGALGFGGIVAMVVGSIILIDTDVPGFSVSRSLIGSIAAVSALGLMAIIAMAVKARTRPIVAGREQLMGTRGVALESFDREGHVFAHGERWSAMSEAPVHKDQAVEITGLDGLILKVRPLNERPQEQAHV
jgi:membrane-bound serine protease (ClpP class)